MLKLKNKRKSVVVARHGNCTTVLLGLGSNLGDSTVHLQQAVDLLGDDSKIDIKHISELVKSSPIGPQDQPDYLNLCMSIDTFYTPFELLDVCQQIERSMGRQPGRRWGERLIDIDILVYGNDIIEDERLVIPHSQLKNRLFVLVPLSQIVPDYHIIGLGKVCDLKAQCLSKCADQSVRYVGPLDRHV